MHRQSQRTAEGIRNVLRVESGGQRMQFRMDGKHGSCCTGFPGEASSEGTLIFLLLPPRLWQRFYRLEQRAVSPEQLAELDRRMEAYRKDPTQVTTWEAIKTRILGGADAA